MVKLEENLAKKEFRMSCNPIINTFAKKLMSILYTYWCSNLTYSII